MDLHHFQDLLLCTLSGINFACQDVRDLCQQSGQDKIDDCDRYQREERLIGAASDDISHLGEIQNRNIAYNCCCFQKSCDLTLV